MPIADIARLTHAKLTHQQIADMMLSEDRLRRAALERHDWDSAEAHDEELIKMARLMRHAA